MITVNGLTKSYAGLTALADISFTVESGEICGILGPNGAGKTTLLRILCGLTSYEGTVTIGSDARKPVGAIIEKPKLFGYLNMDDNLRLFSGLQEKNLTAPMLADLKHKVGLPADRKDPVKQFSMGMKQRLGIAVALLGQPDILILDEPFSGLDPSGVRETRQLISGLVKEDGLTVLISSHLTGELENLCDRLIVLRHGRLIHDSLIKNYADHEKQPYCITTGSLPSTISLNDYRIIGNTITANLTRTEANQLLADLLNQGVDIHDFHPADFTDRFFNEP